jgi:hypothetical protein
MRRTLADGVRRLYRSGMKTALMLALLAWPSFAFAAEKKPEPKPANAPYAPLPERKHKLNPGTPVGGGGVGFKKGIKGSGDGFRFKRGGN